MSFKDQSFANRWHGMGDIAEKAFEHIYTEVAPKQKVQRYGFDRACINISQLPAFVRYTPDYMTAKGLVEVQGFGRDQVFKLKHDKFEALCDWQNFTDWRVDIFVWDSKNSRFAWVRLADLCEAIPAVATTREFDAGKPYAKPYWAVKAEDLPTVDGWREVVLP